MNKILVILGILFLTSCHSITKKQIDKCINLCEGNGGMDSINLYNGACVCKNKGLFPYDIWKK